MIAILVVAGVCGVTGFVLGRKITTAAIEAKLKGIEQAVVTEGIVLTDDLKNTIAIVVAAIRAKIS